MTCRALGKADWQILLAGLQKRRGCVVECIYQQESWSFIVFLLRCPLPVYVWLNFERHRNKFVHEYTLIQFNVSLAFIARLNGYGLIICANMGGITVSYLLWVIIYPALILIYFVISRGYIQKCVFPY